MGEPILIVDDNPANLMLLQFLLQKHGHQVRAVADAEQALAALEAGYAPRLVLLDLRLPGMDGLALTRKLRAGAATRDVPIVAVTAHAMRGDREAALAAGCDGFVTKPIDTRTLPEVVAGFLARGR
jgi:CheY-like chemotaxis protein